VETACGLVTACAVNKYIYSKRYFSKKDDLYGDLIDKILDLDS
jgi:hypothetical protein